MKNIIAFALAFILGMLAACGGGSKPNYNFNSSPQVNVTPQPAPGSGTTNAGVKLKSTGPVSQAVKDGIDKGLLELFEDAKHLGYRNMVSPGDYTVIVKQDCEPSPESKTPSWRVIAPNYNNTEWDINPDPNIGEVYAAELVTTSGPNAFKEFTICNSEDIEGYVVNVARYGGEHPILYWNDRARYNATATHIGGGHPIIPSRPTQ